MDGAARELREADVEDPRLEAERLVCHAVEIDRAELAGSGSEPLSPAEARALARAVARRVAGEPLQHIEGTVQFRELVLLADPRAFIPRPETEQLVDRVEAWAEERGGSGGEGVRTVGRRGRREEPLLEAALDVGTGSGAIALSLVHERIARRAVGVDVSSEALLQAAANRGAAEIDEERVEFRLAERPVWASVGSEERFDLIVSNPPYVSDAQWEELPEEIREHEPREALLAGPAGMEVIREIVGRAPSYLRPGGALFLEIGHEQGDAVGELLEEGGGWERVEVERDLAGRDRFAFAQTPRDEADGE